MKIPPPSAGRRALTGLGVALSILLGVATIRAAGAWTAAAAPLTVTPPTANELRAALELERARSATLGEQLDRLASSTDELEAALAAAESRIAQDAADAEALRANLAAARERLTQLEASLRAARDAAVAKPGHPEAGSNLDHEEDHERDSGFDEDDD